LESSFDGFHRPKDGAKTGLLKQCLIRCCFIYTANNDTPPTENKAMLGHKIQADSRVSQLLEELDIEYQTDEDGDFQVDFQHGEQRSQTVFISSSTDRIGDLDIRRVYSIGYMSKVPLSQKIANLLLGINHSSRLGAWQVMNSKDDYYAAYNVQIAASTDADTLFTVLKAVVESADSIEDYLTGMDVF